MTKIADWQNDRKDTSSDLYNWLVARGHYTSAIILKHTERLYLETNRDQWDRFKHALNVAAYARSVEPLLLHADDVFAAIFLEQLHIELDKSLDEIRARCGDAAAELAERTKPAMGDMGSIENLHRNACMELIPLDPVLSVFFALKAVCHLNWARTETWTTARKSDFVLGVYNHLDRILYEAKTACPRQWHIYENLRLISFMQVDLLELRIEDPKTDTDMTPQEIALIKRAIHDRDVSRALAER